MLASLLQKARDLAVAAHHGVGPCAELAGGPALILPRPAASPCCLALLPRPAASPCSALTLLPSPWQRLRGPRRRAGGRGWRNQGPDCPAHGLRPRGGRPAPGVPARREPQVSACRRARLPARRGLPRRGCAPADRSLGDAAGGLVPPGQTASWAGGSGDFGLHRAGRHVGSTPLRSHQKAAGCHAESRAGPGPRPSDSRMVTMLTQARRQARRSVPPPMVAEACGANAARFSPDSHEIDT